MRRHAILRILLLVFASLAAAPAAAQPRVAAISAGTAFTCALDAEGRAFCWGWDQDGQLGAGKEAADRCGLANTVPGPCALEPVPVAGGLRFRAIDAGHEHACALTAEGEAYCWGSNEFGELGVAAAPDVCTRVPYGRTEPVGTPCSRAPARVATDVRFAEISAADRYTCGRTAGGAAWCWGGSWHERPRQVPPGPARIGGELRFRSVEAGNQGACGVSDAGAAYCWTSEDLKPRRYDAPAAFASATAGWAHVCALTADGAAWCWGENNHGQLGTGAAARGEDHPPAPVAGGLRFRRLEAGLGRTCGLAADGALYCWGSPPPPEKTAKDECYSVDASSPCNLRPARMGTLAFRSFSMGLSHMCGIAADGDAVCWGYGTYGSLGRAVEVSSKGPLRIALPVQAP